jgi:hypothetical protein
MTDPPRAGLCESCAYRRDVVTENSRFVLCTRSFDDAAYPKYPRLPVVRCAGYVEKRDGAPAGMERD